ncbi:TorF family putative porin [Saccharophagus degradans]|uniref:TorF family putative porin n=1 Tax=Saccharophagus degradans TaxID=86304 RepID=A0AAW7X623_9GAMM|nr:TorF family putative porin [Saccharophagus degradans]MDO6423300.1 TorF family putative porin [Saccharophagus degradans]MDO6606705.1 TorF family putative porin [Saccharophagus degradans]
MNSTKKLLATAVAASTMAVAAMAPVANAEVSASVGVASTYLWRGYDLGSGTPAVSGDLNFSQSGFYTGIWGSSGDTLNGSEFDLYIGYGGEVGDFSYDLSIWSYVYPGTPEGAEIGVGDLMEGVISLGYGPVAFTYYENLEGGDGYNYMTLGAGIEKFSVLVGQHSGDLDESTHLDLSYAYNDNLSFTLSTILSSNDGDTYINDEDEEDMIVVDGDVKFVVSYSLPIGE